MARKPLLSSPVLTREDVQSRLAGEDLMSRIIDNDREKNGRSPRPTPPAAPVPGEEYVNKLTNKQINKLTDAQVNRLVNKLTNVEETEQAGSETDTTATAGSQREDSPPLSPVRSDTAPGGREGAEDSEAAPAAVAATELAVATPEPPARDALTQAYLATISRPYQAYDAKTPRVLVAGRVHTEVSERFELVCTMLKKKGDKQDVLEKALQVFIAHVVERQGDVEL